MSYQSTKKMRLGARASDLSRIQVYSVAQALKRYDPQIEVEFVLKKAEGDIDRTTPLANFGDKGVFTRDLTDILVAGDVDAVVHSWKDLPTTMPHETEVVATLNRGDLRDMVFFRTAALDHRSLRVLTCSPRRVYALTDLLTWALPGPARSLEFLSVRGNIPTRFRKLLAGDGDALVVAKAAVDRILATEAAEFAEARQVIFTALSQCRWIICPMSLCPCAPAQGALAIEIRQDRQDLRELFAAINAPSDLAAVTEERNILADFGGGCHQKIGVTVQYRPYGKVRCIRGETDAGQRLNTFELITEKAFPPVQTSAHLYPRLDEEPLGITRQTLSAEAPQNIDAIWAARAEAVPSDWNISANTIVWSAGLSSWRKLAARGIWVNGSAEGLGEAESPGIDLLCSKTLRWVKVSHHDAPAAAHLPLYPTYQLVGDGVFPDLAQRTHFFWMSSSLS